MITKNARSTNTCGTCGFYVERACTSSKNWKNWNDDTHCVATAASTLSPQKKKHPKATNRSPFSCINQPPSLEIESELTVAVSYMKGDKTISECGVRPVRGAGESGDKTRDVAVHKTTTDGRSTSCFWFLGKPKKKKKKSRKVVVLWVCVWRGLNRRRRRCRRRRRR